MRIERVGLCWGGGGGGGMSTLHKVGPKIPRTGPASSSLRNVKSW